MKRHYAVVLECSIMGDVTYEDVLAETAEQAGETARLTANGECMDGGKHEVRLVRTGEDQRRVRRIQELLDHIRQVQREIPNGKEFLELRVRLSAASDHTLAARHFVEERQA